jgi:FAD binding domain/Berberine and berberine like
MTSVIDALRGLEPLRERLSGALVGPGERGWDSARQAWNLAVDQRPAGVLLAADTQDVVRAVALARAHGLGIAAQGTGHGAGTLGDLADTLLLKTIRMADVQIDAERSRARVQAGALWGDVVVAAAEHGLAPLAGSSADVGVVGYTLGGGIGFLARRYGLACNSVSAVEIVTADAELHRVDRDHEPELFWALRGGGGSFGVVTALEFELYPVTHTFAGMLAWPAERAPDVLATYLELTASAPDGFTSSLRLLNLPPIPDVPEPFRGRRVIVIDAAHVGTAEHGERLLRGLRTLGAPLLDTFAVIPARELISLHGDPDRPHPGHGDGIMLEAMPPGAADRFIELGGIDSASPLVSLELRHIGGALRISDPGAGALDVLDGEFVLYAVGSPLDGESYAAIDTHLDLVAQGMRPWTSERLYLNVADREHTAARCFPPETYRRLQRVKQRYDPAGMFRSNRQVEPFAAARPGDRSRLSGRW